MSVKFPITGGVGGDLVGMVLSELRLCKVTREESVVLFTDTRTNPNYVAAFLAAGKETAGSVFEIKVPFCPVSDARSVDLAPVIEILKKADLVVDLSTGSVLYHYGKGLGEILNTGTRVLQVKGAEDQLWRCFPIEDVRKRTVKGAGWLEKAEEIQVMSKAGTDLTMRKAGRPALTQYGVSDIPGRWDSWPSGFLYCAPEEESANGFLVLDRGDLLIMLGRYAHEPVRLSIKDGRIVEIEGGVDAVLLQERLEFWKDPEAFVISHIGWGTDTRAYWTEVAQRGTEEGARDARSKYGNVQIAFGANYQLGGKNKTLAHEDLVLRRATFKLDGRLVIEDGHIIPDELK